MTTPVLPEVADLDTFGGEFANEDPVVDPETEVDATYLNRLIAQVAMLSHTAPRAWARCTVSGGVVTLVDHDAVWGSGGGVAPTATWSATGEYTVEWAATYDDLQATPETHSVGIRAVDGSGWHSSNARIMNFQRSSAVLVTVTSKDITDTPAEVEEFTVFIW